MATKILHFGCVTHLATKLFCQNVRQMSDLADERDSTALAFPHPQFSIRVVESDAFNH